MIMTISPALPIKFQVVPNAAKCKISWQMFEFPMKMDPEVSYISITMVTTMVLNSCITDPKSLIASSIRTMTFNGFFHICPFFDILFVNRIMYAK